MQLFFIIKQISRCGLGNHGGLRPSTPAGTEVPAPNSGNCNSYQANIFPVEQSNTCTFVKKDCLFANWHPHCGPRAGRCGTPPTGCFASGENKKKAGGKARFPCQLFFIVFIAPVGSRSVSSSNMRKEVCAICFLHRRKGAGPMALLRGYGGRTGPCFVSSEKPLLRILLTFPAADVPADAEPEFCSPRCWDAGHRSSVPACNSRYQPGNKDTHRRRIHPHWHRQRHGKGH